MPDSIPTNVMGITSARDFLVVDISRTELIERIRHFVDLRISDEKIRKELFPTKSAGKYLPGDTRGWKLHDARRTIARNHHDRVVKLIAYRPFDNRFIYYCPQMVDWDRLNVMQHFMHGENVGLCSIRINRDDLFTPIATELISDKTILSSKDNANVFPLYLFHEWNGHMEKVPNLNPEIVEQIELKVGKTTPETLFNYIYAVLYSPSYCEKYKEFLKNDFPRIPYPTDADTFHALAEIGAQLVAIHTMKDFPEAGDVTFEGAGDREVEQAKWQDGAVWINRGSCFAGVDEATWLQWIGGYQPLQKWLKDRKHRTLTSADISHYKRMVQALRRTRELMAEIDRLPLPWAGQA